jgi:CBS domain-containing protein
MKVRDIMTTEVVVGQPDDDLEYAISVMKQKKIRHLPILDGQKVIGMISMRDLLGLELAECKAEIRYAPLIPRTRTGGPRLV